MKNVNTMKMMFVAGILAIMMMCVLFNTSITRAEAPIIAPTEITVNIEDSEFIERALQHGDGYEFVKYVSVDETEITYIVEDEIGNQFIITYSEDAEGKPVSSIMVYRIAE